MNQVLSQLTMDIGKRLDYNVTKVDLFFVPEDFDHLSEVWCDNYRNVSVYAYMTGHQTLENLVVDIGTKVVRQWYLDEPKYSKLVRLPIAWRMWNSRRAFIKLNGVIIQRAKVLDSLGDLTQLLKE